MDIFKDTPTWHKVANLEGAKEAIDYGLILNWDQAKSLNKMLNEEELNDIIQHFASRLSERVEDRLPEEILIESLLVFLGTCNHPDVLDLFIDELLDQPNLSVTCYTLVELAITSEIADETNADEIFAVAVALICELGLRLFRQPDTYLEPESTHKMLEHIATYLLSVSNNNHPGVRLSLLNYFGEYDRNKANKVGLNRIMSRFGHTVLEHLFSQLFSKKTEAVALEYLLTNLPYILEGDNQAQKILHETWKYYMLKKPERFGLFIQTMTDHLRTEENTTTIMYRVYLQHLGVLLKTVSDLDHKSLGKTFMVAILEFPAEPYRDALIEELLSKKNLRENYRAILEKMAKSKNAKKVINNSPSFRAAKKGRKPCFSRAKDLKTIQQITYLGQNQNDKAS